MKADLYKYRGVLEYEPEFQLNFEPLRIDLLIIKKAAGVVIDTGIARIFRGHNLFEYKSPDDYLSVDDFKKTLAYVLLYSIHERVPLSDVTLSIVVTAHPRAALAFIQDEAAQTVTKTTPGVHETTFLNVPVQIIQSKLLDAGENQFLSALRKDNDVDSFRAAIDSSDRFDTEVLSTMLAVYLDVISSANPAVYKEVFRMTQYSNFWERVAYDSGLADRLMQEGRQKGRQEGLQEGLQKGLQKGCIETAKNLIALGASIDYIAKATGLSIEQLAQLLAQTPAQPTVLPTMPKKRTRKPKAEK
jgi:hypothetical protein